MMTDIAGSTGRTAPAYLCAATLLLLSATGTAVAAGSASARLELPATSALGAHTLLGQENGNGVSPAVTSPIDTQPNGSALIVFNSGYATNDTPPTDSYGNAWPQLGDTVVYNGYEGQFDIKAYLAMAAHGGPGHTVSIVKEGRPQGEITIPFIEVTGADVLQDVVQNYPQTGPEVTSGSVTTTGPATLVAVWWGDGPSLQNSAIPNHGFTLIENFVDLPPNSAVQCAVAYRQVAGAGTYDVTWTEAPNQGAVLWLFAFQGNPGNDVIFRSGFD